MILSSSLSSLGNAEDGTVIVMSKHGRELGRIVVGGPEISGIAIKYV